MGLSSALIRGCLLLFRFLQFASAAIVLSFLAFLIHRHGHTGLMLYEIVVVSYPSGPMHPALYLFSSD
jgi:hypothetical protein